MGNVNGAKGLVQIPLSLIAAAVLLLRDEAPELASSLERAVGDVVEERCRADRRAALDALATAHWFPLAFEEFALSCALTAASAHPIRPFIFADPDAQFPTGVLVGQFGTADGRAEFRFCETICRMHDGEAFASKLRLKAKEREDLLRLAKKRTAVHFFEDGKLLVRDPGLAGMKALTFAGARALPADILKIQDGRIVRERIGTTALKRLDEETVLIDADPAFIMAVTAASFGPAWFSVNPAESATARRNRLPRLFFQVPSPEAPRASVVGWSNAAITNTAFDVMDVTVGVPWDIVIRVVARLPWFACADERILMKAMLPDEGFAEPQTQTSGTRRHEDGLS